MVQRTKVCRTKTIYNSVMIFVRSHSIIVVNGQLLMHKKRNVYPLENRTQLYSALVYAKYVIWALHRNVILGMKYLCKTSGTYN